MKNLYTKGGKGKIHPSPSSSQPFPANGEAALAVLKLLPAAILALTSMLGFEDKEVVAYLMTRSMNGPAAEAAEERKRCRRVGGVHLPLFDCGCFDCYTSFWSRWDCSPDREVIHQAIEAFEDHLASSEKKGRRRERKSVARLENGKKKNKKGGVKKEEFINEPAEESKSVVEEAVSVSEPCVAEEVLQEVEVVGEVSGDEVSERKRGWADVMGILNSRLWSLWSPEL